MIYEELIRGLNSKRIDYVLIGGFALAMHGIVRATADIDFVLSMDKPNLTRFIGLMKELGYRPKAPVKPEAFLDAEQRKRWMDEKNMLAFSFINPKDAMLLVDVILKLPLDYERIKSN